LIDNLSIDTEDVLYETDPELYSESEQTTEVSVDEEEFQDKLCKLCNEFPSLPILEIYELKYKKNRSVDSIVEMLSLSEDSVIDILCKIIGIVEE